MGSVKSFKMAKRTADDFDSMFAALEKEVQSAAKKPMVMQTQTISAKPVRQSREIVHEAIVPPPPPSVSTYYQNETQPAYPGVAPPPPPLSDQTFHHQPEQSYIQPKQSSAVPVPKQYNALKQSNGRPEVYGMASAGQIWKDDSLHDWPDDDHRIFVGDLGNECNDDLLAQAFSQYSSFQKAKVIRDKRTGKTKGYGFISFTDVDDFMRALREMNGKYVGNRPIKLRKSTWEKRMATSEENAQKETWMKTTVFKSRKHVKAVDAPRHRHGR